MSLFLFFTQKSAIVGNSQTTTNNQLINNTSWTQKSDGNPDELSMKFQEENTK